MIGIRREDKYPWERRAPLTPDQVRVLVRARGLPLVTQPSPLRVFADEEYASAGATIAEEKSEGKRGTTYAELLSSVLPDGKGPVINRLADRLGLPLDHHVIARLEWTGFLAQRPLPGATPLIVEGEIEMNGVQIPVLPEICVPVLEELEEEGIRFQESTRRILPGPFDPARA